MTLAKNELQKTEDLVKMLLDDKTVHLAKLFFFLPQIFHPLRFMHSHAFYLPDL